MRSKQSLRKKSRKSIKKNSRKSITRGGAILVTRILALLTPKDANRLVTGYEMYNGHDKALIAGKCPDLYKFVSICCIYFRNNYRLLFESLSNAYYYRHLYPSETDYESDMIDCINSDLFLFTFDTYCLQERNSVSKFITFILEELTIKGVSRDKLTILEKKIGRINDILYHYKQNHKNNLYFKNYLAYISSNLETINPSQLDLFMRTHNIERHDGVLSVSSDKYKKTTSFDALITAALFGEKISINTYRSIISGYDYFLGIDKEKANETLRNFLVDPLTMKKFFNVPSHEKNTLINELKLWRGNYFDDLIALDYCANMLIMFIKGSD